MAPNTLDSHFPSPTLLWRWRCRPGGSPQTASSPATGSSYPKSRCPRPFDSEGTMERDNCNVALVRLASVSERVAHASSADEGLHAVVQAVKDLFDAQTAAVVLLDEHSEMLQSAPPAASRPPSWPSSAALSAPA